MQQLQSPLRETDLKDRNNRGGEGVTPRVQDQIIMFNVFRKPHRNSFAGGTYRITIILDISASITPMVAH